MEATFNTFRSVPATVTEKAGIKLFIDKNPLVVEEKVNSWLKENDVVLQHLGQSQSEKNGNFIFIITLIYAPKVFNAC